MCEVISRRFFPLLSRPHLLSPIHDLHPSLLFQWGRGEGRYWLRSEIRLTLAVRIWAPPQIVTFLTHKFKNQAFFFLSLLFFF